MAIQHNFKQAYTNKVSQQNQGINTITQGVKSTAIAVGGVAVGASMAMGAGSVGKMVFQNMAGKIGGIGGDLMAQSMQEKLDSAVSAEQNKQSIEADTVSRMTSELGGNPINNPAIKQINTVYDTILQERQNKILNQASKKLGKDVVVKEDN